MAEKNIQFLALTNQNDILSGREIFRREKNSNVARITLNPYLVVKQMFLVVHYFTPVGMRFSGLTTVGV